MSHIAPLAPEEIADPELRALIAEAEALGVPDALFPRILARVPDHAKVLMRALLMSHAEGNVDHRLKEIIRIQLARFAGDPYFAALRSARARRAGLTDAEIEAGCGNYETADCLNAAEKCALRYADHMYRAPWAVDAAMYAELKQHYSEAQIMELGAFIAFHYGMQTFMRTLVAKPLAG
ncbi:MAG TPA: carboxymuconolactone decarboxylase family protein [Candidatus Sulfotelmatobacter sp.]|nr:carboxymuconolactone decarboxylase family protein [Candidatus Sulfotelmatobacter sp.]